MQDHHFDELREALGAQQGDDDNTQTGGNGGGNNNPPSGELEG